MKQKITKKLGNSSSKKKDDDSNLFSDNPMTVYCHYLYKYFGRNLVQHPRFKKFFKNKIYNSKYENILKQANLRLMPEEYFITIYITVMFLIILSVVLPFFLLFVNPLYSVFMFGAIFTLLFVQGIFMYNYPIVVARTRGKEIDASMPYLLPYLKILAKEVNLSKIIEIIDDFLIYKEIRFEFKKIKYYSSFLGYDIHSSIREAMLSCPSRELSDLMNDLVTISNSGGNIYDYLERKLSNLNEEITAIEQKNIDTLLIYSQIYIVLLLIAPLFFTVMTAVLNLINFSTDTGASGTGSFSTIFLLLFGLPFAYIGFMLLVYYSKPLYARLKPLKFLAKK